MLTLDILSLARWVHFVSFFVLVIVHHSPREISTSVFLLHERATKALFLLEMFRLNFPPPTYD